MHAITEPMFYTNVRSPVNCETVTLVARSRLLTRVVLALVVAVGIAIGVAWGLRGAAVYFFCAALAGVLTYAAGVGGELVQDASSRRYGDRDDGRK